MQILSNLIASLKGKDYPVQQVLTGAYWTGVVSRTCGLASTFRDEGHPHPRGVKDVGRLTEKRTHFETRCHAEEGSNDPRAFSYRCGPGDEGRQNV